MAIWNWLCKSSTKSMVVKIIHQGGHVELYERPVLANEILDRNPRCCVAHTYVFKQPWAVVSSETMLMPGETFYLVPTNTIRKLQNNSTRHSRNVLKATEICTDQVGDGAFLCWINKDGKKKKIKYRTRGNSATKTKCKSEIQNDKTKLSSGSSSSRGLYKSGSKSTIGKGDYPKTQESFDSWQPSLDKIIEE